MVTLITWLEANEPPDDSRAPLWIGVDRKALGIPTEEEYVAKYCERVGISGIPIWKFCLAFSFFRLAAIVQGVKKRGLDGNASNPEKDIKSGERIPLMA